MIVKHMPNFRWRHLAGITSVLALQALLIPKTAAAENWALLVGINDYRVINDLRLAEGDATRMKESLIKYAGFKDENTRLLVGKSATKKGIRLAFKEVLIDRVKPGDKALFYFSGHGVQIADKTGQEEDGKDEMLCAQDSAMHTYTFVRDNELGKWMDQVDTTNKIVILDCCHSGTATRALIGFGEQSENIPRVKAFYPGPNVEIRESTLEEMRQYDPDLTEADLAMLTDAGSRGADNSSGFEAAISGCRDDQVSMESPSVGGGVLTNYIIESLRSADSDINSDGIVTVDELWESARRRIQKKGWRQEPQFNGTKGTPIIGETNPVGQDSSSSPPVESTTSPIPIPPQNPPSQVMQVSGQDLQLSIGSDDGVTRGSIYAVSDTKGNKKATIRITYVEPVSARAQTVDQQTPVQAGDKIELEKHYVESEDLLLFVENLQADGAQAKALAKSLRSALVSELGKIGNLRLIERNEAPDRILAGQVSVADNGRFQVRLRLINVNIGNSTQDRSLHIGSGQVQAAVKTFLADTEVQGQKVDGLASLIRASYVLKALAKIENPKPGFQVNVTLDKGDLGKYQIGDTVDISMQPSRDCYVYVLDIGSSGKINLLFPSEFEPDNFLRKGQQYTIPSTDEYAIELGGPPGEERVKVIATTQKIPLDKLNPEDMDSPIKTYATNAPELLELSMRDLSLRPRNKWVTETVMFTVGKPVVYAGSRDPLDLSILE
jgi:uncharacterized caspase-like protein